MSILLILRGKRQRKNLLLRFPSEVRLEIFQYALLQTEGNNPKKLLVMLCSHQILYDEAFESFVKNENNVFHIDWNMLENGICLQDHIMKYIRNVTLHVQYVLSPAYFLIRKCDLILAVVIACGSPSLY
jgi:hypothetical protein